VNIIGVDLLGRGNPDKVTGKIIVVDDMCDVWREIEEAHDLTVYVVFVRRLIGLGQCVGQWMGCVL